MHMVTSNLPLPAFGARSTKVEPKRAAARPGLREATILAVDDDATARAVIENVLTRQGWTARTVSSYQEWEEAWARGPAPDLLILDVTLAERRGGYEILRVLRKQNTSVPVLMLSARNTATDSVFAKASGANAFVSKVEGEFDHPNRGLVATVRRLLVG
jgi:CheY-like chemotaxis protein